MSYIIQVSSAPKAEQLLDLQNRGFDKVELHLMDSDVQKAFANWKSAKMDVHSIHTPVVNGAMCNLNEILTPEVHDAVVTTAYFAQTMASTIGQTIRVVIHCPWSLYEFECSQAMKPIVDTFKELQSTCPDVYYVLENSFPLESGKLRSCVFVQDIVPVCKLLNRCLGSRRFGICLDICHLQCSITWLRNALLSTQHTSIEEAFDMFKLDVRENILAAGSLLWNMHVSTSKGLSDTRETHAMPLNFDDVEDWHEMLKIVPEDCLLTIEVREDDYCKCINAEKTLYYLNKALKGMI